MGILNIQKVPSWVILNIHEAKSWVFWIFMKWRHRHFECSKADVKWIFKSWRHGHFEYLWGDVIGILNTKWRYGIIQLTPWVFWIFIVTLVFLIFIQNYVGFWIFKVMTSLHEYSHDGNSWVFKIPMTCIFTTPMVSACEYSKYPWRQLLIFKIPIRSALNYLIEYSNYPWGHFMNNHDVTSWVFKRPITSLHEFTK